MKNKNLLLKNGGFLFSVTVVIYIIVSFFGVLLLKAVTEQGSFLYNATSPLFSVISIGIVLPIFMKKSDVSLKEYFSVKKFSPVFILLSLLLTVSMFFGLGFINNFLGETLKSIGLKVNESALTVNNFYEYITYVMTWGVFPAFFEEALFRGGVFFGINKKNPLSVSFFSGLLFFLYHMSMAQSVYQFVFGVFLFLLYLASGSVIPCVISHFINNFAVLTLNYLNVVIDLSSLYFIILGILGLAVFCIVTLKFIRTKAKDGINEKDGEVLSLKNLFIYSSFGIIVCAIVIILGLFVG